MRMTQSQHIARAILCACEICGEQLFATWAVCWLDGSDRSREAAQQLSWELRWALGEDAPESAQVWTRTVRAALEAAAARTPESAKAWGLEAVEAAVQATAPTTAWAWAVAVTLPPPVKAINVKRITRQARAY